ncbi:CRISPR-associated protein 1 [Blyttiomyces sp. JEL0837]|nr:CRISPR-associated protein 1 [Blyttiomyces sp. JEL0837]
MTRVNQWIYNYEACFWQFQLRRSRNSIEQYEADTIISQIEPSRSLMDIGSRRWLLHHENMERLNIQSHLNVQNDCEEFITESFLSHEKIPALIHDLLEIDLWKSKVFPLVVKEAAKSTVKSYFILYHEATIVNLLEILFYKKEAVIAGGSILSSLADYCSRKMAILNAWEFDDDKIEDKEKKAKELLDMTEEKSLQDRNKELAFAIAINSLSILRYMTDFINELELPIVTQILNKNETICSAVYLLEKSPWLREYYHKGEKKKVISRFDSGNWKIIPRDELPRLSKVEAQVWIMLYNLLLDPECRRKYIYTTQNKEIILRLKNFLEEELVDQLPVLVHLQRYLEELIIFDPSSDVSVIKSNFLVEEMSGIEDELKDGKTFKEIANAFKKLMAGETTSSLREDAMSYTTSANWKIFWTIQFARNAESLQRTDAPAAKQSGIAGTIQKQNLHANLFLMALN